MKRQYVLAITVFIVLAMTVAVYADKAKETEATPAPSVFDSAQAVGTPATCPVMKGSFNVNENTLHSEVDGKHVYFCCADCKGKFDADPAKYLKEDSEHKSE